MATGARERTAAAMRVEGVLTIEVEQRENMGEDASLALFEPCCGVFACMDGCGGAGAKRYAVAENWTGARLASRICGNAIADWAEQNSVLQYGLEDVPAERIAHSVQNAIMRDISAAHKLLGTESALSSHMIKSLPTTLSAVLIDACRTPVRNLFLWAGDSRGYLFTPDGLVQMTTDDIRGNLDAMENLINDGVMTNLVSASEAFTIHVREAYLNAPYMAIVATDGCFSYFRSPIQLESILLGTLMAAKSPADWEGKLSEELGAVASDDYAMRIAIVGYPSFQRLQAAFRVRERQFSGEYRAPLGKMLREGDTEGLRQLWQKYKREYEYGGKVK